MASLNLDAYLSRQYTQRVSITKIHAGIRKTKVTPGKCWLLELTNEQELQQQQELQERVQIIALMPSPLNWRGNVT